MSTDIIKIDAAAAGSQLSAAVSRSRALVERVADNIGRDLVQVQAAEIIRQALTPEIKALILAAGAVGQYEVVEYGDHKVKPEAQVAVCVQAFTMGLRMSGGQFAAWGDWKGDAKLYIKAGGYRELLNRDGRASGIQAHVGFPEFVVNGKSKKGHDKGVAYMTGEAHCMWDGVRVEVTAPEQFRIGIPWTATDNVDGIIAKGERRMLARLWAACSGIEESDDTSTVAEAAVVEPVAYEVVPEPASGRDWDKEKAAYIAEWKALPDTYVKDVYLEVMRAAHIDELASLVSEAAKEQMDRRHRDALTRAVDFRREWLAAQEVAP